jgi:Glycosyltransferase family 87
MRSVRGWVCAAAVLLVVGWLVTFFVSPWSDESNTDVTHFPPRAQEWVDGKLPYKDVRFEYPPGAVPIIGLPQLVKVGSYKLGFGLIELAAGLALLALCAEAARLSDGDARRAAFGVAVTPFLAGTLMRGYFDVVPIALTVAALVAIVLARTRWGFALLGLAAMTKGFPLVVAPVAIAWLFGRGERRRALEGAAVMGAVIVTLAAVVVALSPRGAWYAIHYQTARPLEIESSPATLLYVWDWVFGQHGHTFGSYGSINLVHGGSGPVTVLFGVILLAVLASLSWLAARLRTPRALLLGSLAAVASFAAFGKVFSPQYVIWLVPLLALSFAWRHWWVAGLAAVATVLTKIEFPKHFSDVAARRVGGVLLITERNLMVITLIGLSLWSLWATNGTAEPEPQ